MSKAAKVLLSVLIVFGGLTAWGFAAVGLIGPERLARSAVPGTILLSLTAVVCGLALMRLWWQPRRGIVDVPARRPTTAARFLGGMLLIAFALVGGTQNLSSRPLSEVANVSALLMMGVFIVGGMRLMGILASAPPKK